MKKIQIVLIGLCVILLCTSIFFGKKYSYSTYVIEKMQAKNDETFIDSIYNLVLGGNYSNMTEDEITQSLYEDVILCEQANTIFDETSFSEYQEFGLSLSYLSFYLKDLAINQDKIDENVMDGLSTQMLEVWHEMDQYHSNSSDYNKKNMEKSMDIVINTIDELYEKMMDER